MWATGYRSDYSWIRLPVLGPHGLSRHQRGVTEFPGLYFLGMHNQYSRGSSLIHWVRHDAAYIVSHLGARTSGTGTRDDRPGQAAAGTREQASCLPAGGNIRDLALSGSDVGR